MVNDKFRDRYRVSSARLPQWNYASIGWYFVTVCTKNRECHFGDVIVTSDNKYDVRLSDLGKIVKSELLKLRLLDRTLILIHSL